MTDSIITPASESVPSNAAMRSILVSARIAKRVAAVDDLDVTAVPHDAIAEAIAAMNCAHDVFAELAALCEAGSRKLESAAGITTSRRREVLN